MVLWVEWVASQIDYWAKIKVEARTRAVMLRLAMTSCTSALLGC